MKLISLRNTFKNRKFRGKKLRDFYFTLNTFCSLGLCLTSFLTVMKREILTNMNVNINGRILY
jgi:hypothetical protein